MRTFSCLLFVLKQSYIFLLNNLHDCTFNKQCNINFSKLQVENKLLKEKFGEVHQEILSSSVAASNELREEIYNHVKFYLLKKQFFYGVHLRTVTNLLKSSSTSISCHRKVIH